MLIRQHDPHRSNRYGRSDCFDVDHVVESLFIIIHLSIGRSVLSEEVLYWRYFYILSLTSSSKPISLTEVVYYCEDHRR